MTIRTDTLTRHPVLACTSTMDAALDAVADRDPMYMSTSEKQDALVELTRVAARLEELRLRVLAEADDVAVITGARDAAAWLATATHADRARARRDLRVALTLSRQRPVAAEALRAGRISRAHADVVIDAVDALPDHVEPATVVAAEARLVTDATQFSPTRLRELGRKILEVVAPQTAEDHERRLLEAEDARAEAQTRLTTRRRGDGTTDIRIRVADIVADRLLTYLHAFTSPRQPDRPATKGRRAAPADDPRPWPQRLGQAFGAFLESADPDRLPLHGGDATTVTVTIDFDALRTGLGTALVGDQPITAGEARRLACTAHLLPAVLGGRSEVLDLGRKRRLYTSAQRRALAVRDGTCRADGCDIPAAWCEAHHAGDPWSRGGATDFADGALLCSHHHHRAHDHRYDTTRLPDGSFRFHRRT